MKKLIIGTDVSVHFIARNLAKDTVKGVPLIIFFFVFV
jgi:hypothetical protein